MNVLAEDVESNRAELKFQAKTVEADFTKRELFEELEVTVRRLPTRATVDEVRQQFDYYAKSVELIQVEKDMNMNFKMMNASMSNKA